MPGPRYLLPQSPHDAFGTPLRRLGPSQTLRQPRRGGRRVADDDRARRREPIGRLPPRALDARGDRPGYPSLRHLLLGLGRSVRSGHGAASRLPPLPRAAPRHGTPRAKARHRPARIRACGAPWRGRGRRGSFGGPVVGGPSLRLSASRRRGSVPRAQNSQCPGGRAKLLRDHRACSRRPRPGRSALGSRDGGRQKG